MNRRNSSRRRKTRYRLTLLLAAPVALGACSPYASVDIGAPFKVGPVYVNPRIGVGSFL